jgi:phage-related protein
MNFRDTLHFSYAGQKSIDYGIINVNIDGGMLMEPFVSGRRLQETNIRGRDKPYFQGVSKDPLGFAVSFAFLDNDSFKNMSKVAKWLCEQKYYQPLFFTSDISRIYYALPIESSELFYTGGQEGYFTLNFRTSAPYAYSPLILSQLYESDGSLEIKLNNNGQLPIKPEIYVNVPDVEYSAGFSIHNLTNENKGFAISELAGNENLYINADKEFINTSLENTYRYDNLDGDFLELLPGHNRLKIQGDINLYFRYQCKLI